MIAGILLFFIPGHKRNPSPVYKITEKVDERDIMFAREEYESGTEKYQEYYSSRPELREIDDKIRRLPPLLKPGGRFYDPHQSEYINTIFEIIEKLGEEVDGTIGPAKTDLTPASATSMVRDMVISMGAGDVGIADLNPMFVYSHMGRGPEKWGSPINNNHKFAVVFALEMRYANVETAPRLPITEESALEYLKGALISIILARLIRSLGYPARAHIAGSNYQIMLPPVAVDAGLGELGRIGYLVSRRFGARCRLGAITTDLPLIPDGPQDYGIRDFCEKCRKCAVNCPSGAIPNDEKSIIRGVDKWPLNIESCIRYWRLLGTDCGLCMKVCPFSHPDSPAHNIIRAGIARSPVARRISIWSDDLFYGKDAAHQLNKKE